MDQGTVEVIGDEVESNTDYGAFVLAFVAVMFVEILLAAVTEPAVNESVVTGAVNELAVAEPAVSGTVTDPVVAEPVVIGVALNLLVFAVW